MSLSSDSNKINALGIFGRLSPELENKFAELERKHTAGRDEMSNGVFNHLSLVINNNVSVNEIPKYLDLLKDLKPYLPFTIKTSDVIVIDKKHIALSFDMEQTQKIRAIASKYFNEGIIKTYYTKVVWFVSEEKQEEVIRELKNIKEMIFYDFILVANKQNDENTIYSSNRYQ